MLLLYVAFDGSNKLMNVRNIGSAVFELLGNSMFQLPGPPKLQQYFLTGVICSSLTYKSLRSVDFKISNTFFFLNLTLA